MSAKLVWPITYFWEYVHPKLWNNAYSSTTNAFTTEDITVSYLIPRTDDPARKHKQVTHGNQACPDDQGENPKKLLENGLNADEYKNRQEDSQRCGHSDHKCHVVLNVLKKETI